MSDQLPPSGHQLSGELRVLLFGDQALDTRSFLHNQLIVGRTNPLLCLFLDRTTLALRQAVSELSPLEQGSVPPFSSIDDLVTRSSEYPKGFPAVDSALLCISQIAQYFE